MAGNSEALSKDICKYCKSGVKNSFVTCNVCCVHLHSSCAQRNCVIYCKTCKNPEEKQGQHSDGHATDFSKEAYENLKLLAEEQALTNKLLIEKINYLERKLSEAKNLRQLSVDTGSEVNKQKTDNSYYKHKANPKDKKEKDKKGPAENTLGSKNVEPPKTNKHLESYQQQVMKNIINLENDVEVSRVNKSDGEEFQKVSYKRSRKYKKPNIGTGETTPDNNTLEAINPGNDNKKLWLFISRVKETAQESDVRKYIANKADIEEEQVSARSLDTKSVTSGYRCYMIGVPMDLIDRIYEKEFWPSGIAFSRFDFKRGRHFLENTPRRNSSSQD